MHAVSTTWRRLRVIPVWHGGMLETGIGRAGNVALASLPNFTLPGDISANDRYFVRDIVFNPFTVNSDSTLTVPDAPGCGADVDESVPGRNHGRALGTASLSARYERFRSGRA